MIAGFEIGDGLTHLLDYAGRLMAQNCRRRMRIQTFDKMQVAVADAAGRGPHQHLVFLRLVDLDLFDRQRLMGSVKDSGSHIHRDLP